MSTPDREPTSFTAGDTIAWTRTSSDYPPSAGWVLAYRFINAAAKFDVACSGSGDTFTASETAANTANLTPGLYTWQAYVTKATERYTLAEGTCEVLPNLAAKTAGYDTRTPARKALDALNAGLATFGGNAHVQEYEIEGRKMRYRTFADFMAARDRLIQDVAREEAAQSGRPQKNKVRVQFR